MASIAPIEVTITVEQTEPLAGRVGTADGEMQPFSGWIGLAAHLELLFKGDDLDPATRRPVNADRATH